LCHTNTNLIQTSSDNLIKHYEQNNHNQIDEDNDIYEMTVNNVVYTLDNVYDSEYGQLFDELNMSIELL